MVLLIVFLIRSFISDWFFTDIFYVENCQVSHEDKSVSVYSEAWWVLFRVKHKECSPPLPVQLSLAVCCMSPPWQSFSLTVLSLEPAKLFPVTGPFSHCSSVCSFPWLPPHYSSLSLECLPSSPSAILCLPALLYFLSFFLFLDCTCYFQT